MTPEEIEKKLKWLLSDDLNRILDKIVIYDSSGNELNHNLVSISSFAIELKLKE